MMTDLEEPPGSSHESPTSSDAQEPPPAEPPPTSPTGSSPPTEGQNSSPPQSSKTTPPNDSSSFSSPPSNSRPSPPSPNSSPPPYSRSSPPTPPKHSGSSEPSPPSGSESSKPPPPSNANSSQEQGTKSPALSPPPPADSDIVHPPPAAPNKPPPSIIPAPKNPSLSPPNSPPESIPAPAVSNSFPPPIAGSPGLTTLAQTVSPPLPKSPLSVIPSPQVPGSSPAIPTPNIVPSNEANHATPSTSTPTSQTSNNVPKITPPSRPSDFGSSISSNISSKSTEFPGSLLIIGMTLAGVVMISLVAFFLVMARKRKTKVEAFADQNRPKPNSFPAQPGPPPAATVNDNGNYGGCYSPAPEPGIIDGAKLRFSYEELMEITNGFSQENIIGEGGFGCVYKGSLSDGRVVAVKQLKAGSGQGEREFRAEVEIISRVHHRHLVSLVGYCIAEHHRLLVYEFVPNKTLEHHLHKKEIPVIDWSKRVKVAIGSARGLAYLHEDCHPKIIHRDIKSANILLDDNFEAKVADFGLAKLTNDSSTHVSTRVMGTFGYLAPEYASSGKLTDRSDVFSFGVVLLELVTGRKPIDRTQPLGDESLVEWARPLLVRALETGNFDEIVDPRLEKRYVESEMLRMVEAAAACVRHSAPKRPRMIQVVRALDSNGDVPDLTNGVKFGQSTILESGQCSELQRFHMMAFGGSVDSSEYDMYSAEHNSSEVPRSPSDSHRPENGSSEF